MATETELKLAIEPAERRALLRHRLIRAAHPLGSRKLVNTYFDTPDLALRRRGVALRLRRQGRTWLQTVKCAGVAAGGLSSRPEWEVPWAGGEFDFSIVDDHELRRWLERPRLRRRLGPVFQTSFARRSWRSEPSPGIIVLMMLDVGEVASDGNSVPLSELELELAAGEAADLLDIARELASELELRPEPLSKAQRGYMLFEKRDPQPQRAATPPLSPELDVEAGFRSVTLACLAQLQGNEAGARLGRDPEFVHQMRVALRRLRSALRLFAPMLNPEPAAEIDAGIARLATRLGVARDWDVLMEDTLQPVTRAFPDDERLSALATAATARRRAAQSAASLVLQEPDYAHLILSVLAFCHGRTTVRAQAHGERLPRFAARRIEALARRVSTRARRAASLEVEALHRLRIAVKRLRYGLEFFGPVLPEKAVRRAQRHMAALQDDLGFLNDQATAARILAELAGHEPALREAAAMVAGWYGPRYRAVMERLPGEVSALVRRGVF